MGASWFGGVLAARPAHTLSTSMSATMSPAGPWHEADLRVLACMKLALPTRTKFVNKELAKGYKGVPWQTIKDSRAKLYRGVLQQEQARVHSAQTATSQQASLPSTTGTVRSPAHVRQEQEVSTPAAYGPRSGQLTPITTPRGDPPSPPATPSSSPGGPPQEQESNDRPWTADDTRALAPGELQALASMVCDEELTALLPRRSRESVRKHRR
ncbi:unnamed protein product, partial [Ixodes hexagonus]